MVQFEAKVDVNGCFHNETFNKEINYFNQQNRSANYYDWYN